MAHKHGYALPAGYRARGNFHFTRLNCVCSARRLSDGADVVFKQLLAAESLPPGIDVEKAGGKFDREICILKTMSPLRGVPPLQQSGRKNGLPFHICLKAEGETLKYFQDIGRRFEPAEGLALLTALAEVLGEIHALGVCHRDLSPEHVFLSGSGRVTLIDFGMAERAEDCASPLFNSYIGRDMLHLGLLFMEAVYGGPLFTYGSESFLTTVAAGPATLKALPLPGEVKGLVLRLVYSDGRIPRLMEGASIPGYAGLDEFREDLAYCRDRYG